MNTRGSDEEVYNLEINQKETISNQLKDGIKFQGCFVEVKITNAENFTEEWMKKENYSFELLFDFNNGKQENVMADNEKKEKQILLDKFYTLVQEFKNSKNLKEKDFLFAKAFYKKKSFTIHFFKKEEQTEVDFIDSFFKELKEFADKSKEKATIESNLNKIFLVTPLLFSKELKIPKFILEIPKNEQLNNSEVINPSEIFPPKSDKKSTINTSIDNRNLEDIYKNIVELFKEMKNPNKTDKVSIPQNNKPKLNQKEKNKEKQISSNSRVLKPKMFQGNEIYNPGDRKSKQGGVYIQALPYQSSDYKKIPNNEKIKQLKKVYNTTILTKSEKNKTSASIKNKICYI